MAVGGVLLGQRCCQRCSRWLVGGGVLCGHGSIAICGKEKRQSITVSSAMAFTG